MTRQVVDLHAAITNAIDLGERDPITIARTIGRRYGQTWLTRELAARSEEIVTDLARQKLGARQDMSNGSGTSGDRDGSHQRRRT